MVVHCRAGFLTPVANLLGSVRGPKYDGVFLHDKIKSLTHDVKVADTVTNIIVPAFDVKYLQPMIFSTYEAKNDTLKNAHLSDICISTSAAPTYFPAHFFKTEAADGRSREYHLVDGGVAANNPTMVAISMLTKEVHRRNLDFNVGRPTEYTNYLVISVGTGSAKQAEKYTAEQCAKWGHGASFSGCTTVASRRSSTSSHMPVPTWLTSMHPCSFRPSTVRRTTFAFRYDTFVGYTKAYIFCSWYKIDDDRCYRIYVG